MQDEKPSKYLLTNPKYFDLEYITAHILIFIYREATPDWIIEEKLCDFADISYIADGEADYIVNGEHYHVKKGDLLCIPHKSTRSAVTSGKNPAKLYAVNAFLFNFNGRNRDETVDLPLPVVSQPPNPQPIEALFAEMNEAWLGKRSGHILKCRTTLMRILHEILEQMYFPDYPAPVDPRVSEVLHYIATHYHEKITVNQLAEQWNLSPVYLGVLFKNYMNVGIRRYLNLVRVAEAEKLLKAGCTASEASTLCGFDDLFYFSKVYKAVKGFPPSATKRQL